MIRDKVIPILAYINIKKKRNLKSAIAQIDDDMPFADLQAFSMRGFTRKSSAVIQYYKHCG